MFESTKEDITSSFVDSKYTNPPFLQRSISAPAIAEHVSDAILPPYGFTTEDVDLSLYQYGNNPNRLNPRIAAVSKRNTHSDEHDDQLFVDFLTEKNIDISKRKQNLELLDDSVSLPNFLSDSKSRNPMDLIQADFPSTPSSIYSSRRVLNGESRLDQEIKEMEFSNSKSMEENPTVSIYKSTNSSVNPSLTNNGNLGTNLASTSNNNEDGLSQLDQTSKQLQNLYLDNPSLLSSVIPSVTSLQPSSILSNGSIGLSNPSVSTGNQSAISPRGGANLSSTAVASSLSLLQTSDSILTIGSKVGNSTLNSSNATHLHTQHNDRHVPNRTTNYSLLGNSMPSYMPSASTGNQINHNDSQANAINLGLNLGTNNGLNYNNILGNGSNSMSMMNNSTGANDSHGNNSLGGNNLGSTIGSTSVGMRGMSSLITGNTLSPALSSQQTHQQPQPAYYIQQAVYLDQNGQPVYFRPAGPGGQFGQDFMYSPNLDGSGMGMGMVGGMVGMGLGAGELNPSAMQGSFMTYPQLNHNGLPAGYWTTGNDQNGMQGSLPMYLSNGQQSMNGIGLNSVDPSRRMVYNPSGQNSQFSIGNNPNLANGTGPNGAQQVGNRNNINVLGLANGSNSNMPYNMNGGMMGGSGVNASNPQNNGLQQQQQQQQQHQGTMNMAGLPSLLPRNQMQMQMDGNEMNGYHGGLGQRNGLSGMNGLGLVDNTMDDRGMMLGLNGMDIIGRNKGLQLDSLPNNNQNGHNMQPRNHGSNNGMGLSGNGNSGNNNHGHFRGNGEESGGGYRDNRDNRDGGREYRNNDRRDRNDRGGNHRNGNQSNGNNNSNGANPLRDSLVEEFRNTYGKSRQWNLRDLAGHVVAFCQDQHGSRFIQQRLEVCPDSDKQVIFDEILPLAESLMTDVFGNYVLQKLFEYGNADQCAGLASLLKGQAVQLAMQMYGCRVVQKALEYVATSQLIELVSEFENPTMLLKCVHDSNGNHVIQKCIEIVSKVAKEAPTPEMSDFLSSKIQYIITAFQGKVKDLSSHPYGCRVVQRILEHCSAAQKNVILEELRKCCSELVQDCYGNYVIQFVMQHGWEADRAVLIREVQANLLDFSQHKFASNVVEKCLQYANKKDRDEMIWTIINVTFDLKNPVDAKGHCVLESMVRDPYANYVVQKVIDVSDERQRAAIMRYVKENITQLRRYTYGKHIIVRLEKITNEKF